MKHLPDIVRRLAAVKRSLEAISTGQRYTFTSLKSKRSIMPGTYDLSASVSSGDSYFRIVAVPNSLVALPLNLDVRFRVGNPDVLANPAYETTSRFIALNRQIPGFVTGTHTLDIRYSTTTAETVYFKVIATGMDDYTITMEPLSP